MIGQNIGVVVPYRLRRPKIKVASCAKKNASHVHSNLDGVTKCVRNAHPVMGDMLHEKAAECFGELWRPSGNTPSITRYVLGDCRLFEYFLNAVIYEAHG